MALATLAQAKEFLGITGTDQDALITRLLDAATQYLETQTGRTLAQTTLTEYYDGDGDRTLFVASPPASFENYGVDTYLKIDDVQIDEDAFVVHSGEGRIVLDSAVFSRGDKNVEVKYKGGFATVPADLVQATIELAGAMLKRGRSAGVKSESIGDYSVTYSDVNAAGGGLSPTIDSVVSHYRLALI